MKTLVTLGFAVLVAACASSDPHPPVLQDCTLGTCTNSKDGGNPPRPDAGGGGTDSGGGAADAATDDASKGDGG